MKATLFFHIGAVLSGIFFIAMVTSTVSSIQILQEEPGSESIWILWLVVLLFAGVIALAFWLKSRRKMLVANILIWLPLVPLLLVGGLALLFILHDIFYK